MYRLFVEQSNTNEYYDAGFDDNLFCNDCDNNKIGRYESYFADKIMGKRGPSARKEILETEIAKGGDIAIIHISGLNYDKLKLFFLSLLLRASLTRNKFFREVDISPFHKQVISMIDCGVACEDTKFKVALIYIDGDNRRPYNSVISPRRSKQNGNTHYIFYIACYAIFINVSQFNETPIFEDRYLKSNGTLTKNVLMGLEGRRLFESLMGKGIKYKGPFV